MVFKFSSTLETKDYWETHLVIPCKEMIAMYWVPPIKQRIMLNLDYS